MKKILLGVNFPYYFQISKVSDGDGFFQFTHIFYQNHNISSDYCDNLNPILDKLNVVSLMRIKANLQTKDSKIADDLLGKFGIGDEELENIFDVIAKNNPDL